MPNIDLRDRFLYTLTLMLDSYNNCLYSTRFASINSAATAISGSVAFAAPALMSNTWFPPEQRATATAIGTFFVFMGVGMSFILGESNIYCYFHFFQIIDKIQTFVFFITN